MHASTIEIAVTTNPSDRERDGDRPAAGHAHHLGAGRLALQHDHRREHEQKRNEVGDDAHADQRVVRAAHRSCRPGRETRTPRRSPPARAARRTASASADAVRPNAGGRNRSMPATNGSRAVAANQPPTPPSALSVTSAATVGASHGNADLARHRLHRLHDPLQSRHLLSRKRQQHAQRPGEVEHRDHGAGREDRARHGAPRILDLLAHRRSAFDAAERERDRRPEDDVLQARARHERAGVHRRRRSEAAPGDRRRATISSAAGIQLGDRADVVQPLADVQPDHVHRHGDERGRSSRPR